MAGSTSTSGQEDATWNTPRVALCPVFARLSGITNASFKESQILRMSETNACTMVIIKIISGTTLIRRNMLEDMGITAKYINSVSFYKHTEFNHVDLDKEKYIVILQ